MSHTPEPMDEDPGSPGPPPLQDQNGMEVVAPVTKSAREVTHRIVKAKDRKKIDMSDLNPLITCGLCYGYFIDPVTIVECLHSFCKSCIVKHVEKSKVCPTCDIQIHKTKPLLSLRSDKALQDIVYKVVPGLYRKEMNSRVKFYDNHPDAEPANSEDAGHVAEKLFFGPDDDISMSIEYFDNCSKPDESVSGQGEGSTHLKEDNPNRRYLQCPASVTVRHLKKFITTKYGLDQNFLIDVIYKEDLLPEDHTLVDVAYRYNWRKTSPMRFYYRIYQKTKAFTRKRKKKKTKTDSQSHSKRKGIDNSLGSLGKENGLDVDDSSTNLKSTSNKPKEANKEKDVKKKDGGDKVNSSEQFVKKESKVRSSDTRVDEPSKKKSKLSSDTNSLKASAFQKSVSQSKQTGANNVSGRTLSSNLSAAQTPIKASSQPHRKDFGDKDSSLRDKATGAQSKPVSGDPKAASSRFDVKVPAVSSKTTAVTKSSASTAKPAAVSKSSTSVSKSSTSVSKSSNSVSKTTTSVSKTTTSVSKPTTSVSKPTTSVSKSTSSVSKSTNSVSKLSSSLATKTSTNSMQSTLHSKQSAVSSKPLTSAAKTVKTGDSVPKSNESNKKDVKESKSQEKAADKKSSGEKSSREPLSAKNSSDRQENVRKLDAVLSQQQKQKANDCKKQGGEKEVVEISVEVSASDVKKVLEKKKEKEAKSLSNGLEENHLYYNYSIVDQLKKGAAAAANMAKQMEHPSMMDFARSSDVLNTPKVPPILQGLQPTVSKSSEPPVLSAIVQSLKNQHSLKKSQPALNGGMNEDSEKKRESSPSLSSVMSQEREGSSSPSGKIPDVTKTIGTIVAPNILKSAKDSPNVQKPAHPPKVPKLPVSTSVKPVTSSKDGASSPITSLANSNGQQQMMNVLKMSMQKVGSCADVAKSAESLTKNIPAGTTVTVKTVENKQARLSPPATTKSSAFRMNLSNSSFPVTKSLANPFSAPVTSVPMLNSLAPYVRSPICDIALAQAVQAQYANFAAAATSTQLAMEYARAAAAVQSSPLTTLEFRNSLQSAQASLGEKEIGGLRIPQLGLTRQTAPTVSSFGTSRLQVKVNSDAPKSDSVKSAPASSKPDSVAASTTGGSNSTSNSVTNGVAQKTVSGLKVASGTHSMPAILPFHGNKKVQALPKTTSVQPSRPTGPFVTKSPNSSFSKSPPPRSPAVSTKSSVQSLTDSNPYKTSAPSKPITPNFENELKKATTPPLSTSIANPFKPTQNSNSLKKLVADLNTAQQNTLKNGNTSILASLKKSSDSSKKPFGILDVTKNEKPKELTSS